MRSRKLTPAQSGARGGARNSPAQQAARRKSARLCACGRPRRHHVGGSGAIHGHCARYQALPAAFVPFVGAPVLVECACGRAVYRDGKCFKHATS